MQVPKWRNLLTLRNSFFPSAHFALFHSTPVSLAKWKNKWNTAAGQGENQSKKYIRYATRQKRADEKKALKGLLSNTSCKVSFQDQDMTWTADGDEEDMRQHAKKSSRKARPRHNGNKRRKRKESFSTDYDVHPETIFQATFGNRCFTWTFRSWEDSNFQNHTYGFEWRDGSNQTSNRREWKTSEADTDDDEAVAVGSYADRTTLGLPPRGPLKMEDVKNAFRASALKWHPDKHQGPSQAAAEEKFKLCVNAYKSLCNALS